MKTLTFEVSDALYEAFQQMATTYVRTLDQAAVLHSTIPFLPLWSYRFGEITLVVCDRDYGLRQTKDIGKEPILI